MAEPLRIGVLGAARIVSLALLDPARERTDVCVTHVAARDPGREADFAAKHGLKAAGGYQALLDRDDLDLIYIAIPPSGHCEWSIRALEADKAVLCEKPFAMSGSEAEQMVAAARKNGRPLLEAFHYRFHPIFRRAEALLRDKAIGSVTSARASFCTTLPCAPGEFRWIAAEGGGAIMDLGCYPIHALRTLLDSEPTVSSASSRIENEVDASASASLLFDRGIVAEMDCAMCGKERALNLEIIGSAGRLALSNFILPHTGATLTLEAAGCSITESASTISTYTAQLNHIVNVLLGNESPQTGGIDSVANMRVIDAIRKLAK